ncbi:MAG: ferredoxin [Desulfobacterium sp.]|nr:ferredoxin [Desulfobacterium sp.]
MAKKGKIEVRIEHCKGCGLCLTACKQNSIALSPVDQTNSYGYPYLKMINENCTGCTMCAIMCPDQAIDVYRE